MSDSRQVTDKAMSRFHGKSETGHINASIGNDFSNGRRGMARAVKGAKKFVNSRRRAQDKVALIRERKSLDERR